MLNIKAKSLGQQWSQGQCNIVDHRKLVSVINNDKNKQRWVRGWLRWSRTATSGRGVFLQQRRALWSLEWPRYERSPLGCQNPFQFTEVLQREKMESGTFVPLFVLSSVFSFWGTHRWTEGVLSLGCDCSHTITSSSISTWLTFQPE